MMNKKWSSFENDRLIMESWRHYINEGPEKVEELFDKKREDEWARIAGEEGGPPKLQAIDSEESKDSLLKMLRPLVPQHLNNDQLTAILNFFKQRAKADNMDRLLEIDLSGASRDPRQFSQQTANEFSKLINQHDIDFKPLKPVFIQWLRNNTLTMPAPQAAPAPAGAPEADPTEAPEPTSMLRRLKRELLNYMHEQGIDYRTAAAVAQGAIEGILNRMRKK